MGNNKQQIEQQEHLYKLLLPLEVKALHCIIDAQESTLAIYRGFNWAQLKNQSDQMKVNQELKRKLDDALIEVQTLKLKLHHGKAYIEMAKAFLAGNDGIERLSIALKTGENITGCNDEIRIKIPNLNILNEEAKA